MFQRFMSLAAALILVGVVTPCIQGQYPGSSPVAESLQTGFESINTEDGKSWLSILASDEFEGRETGEPGYQKAADFVAARFAEFGLEPIGDKGTYFQHVKFVRLNRRPEEMSLKVVDTDIVVRAEDGLSFDQGPAQVAGEVVFIAARGRDAKLEDPSVATGKIVILSQYQAFSSEIRRQIERSKPLAVIETSANVGRVRPSSGGLRMAFGMNLEYAKGRITTAVAGRIAEAFGIDKSVIDAKELEGTTMVAPASGKRLELTCAVDLHEVMVPNVVGLVPGSDPSLKDEVVICGSHLDHVGKNGETVYNGADDDGSGSTALLLLARAVAKNPVKPKRSVMFIAVCGEEKGLLGSRYYVEHPIFPIEKTVCELQMDMVGRNEETKKDKPEDNVDTIHLVGSKRISTELHERILALNDKYIKFKFEYDEESVYERSDHYNFALKGIPVAFFFSGFHPDYHQPTDDVEKINFEKIVSTARLVYLTVHDVGNQEKRLVIDKPVPQKEDGR